MYVRPGRLTGGIMSLRNFLRPSTLPGTIEREHQLHPFRPASHAPRSERDNFIIFKRKQQEKQLKAQFFESKRRSKTRTVPDAETGQKIVLTKSVWSAEEGQLGTGAASNFNMKTIMGRGTGQLDIFKSAQPEEKASRHLGPCKSPTFCKFMEEGPLNEYYRQDWSPDKHLKKRKAKVGMLPQSPIRSSLPLLEPMSTKSSNSLAEITVSPSNQIIPIASPLGETRKDLTNTIGTTSANLAVPSTEAEEGNMILIRLDSARSNSTITSETSGLLVSNTASEEGDSWEAMDAMRIDDKEIDFNIDFDFNKLHQQFFKELKRAALYINSKQTERKRKSREDVERASKRISYLKTARYRDVYNAVMDEKKRETKRQAELLVLTDEKDRKDMRARHLAERKAAQNYIRQIQYDHEVLLIQQMKAENLLW